MTHINTDLQKSLNSLKVRFLIGGLLLLLAMIGFSAIWNASVKSELSQQATAFVRSTLASGDPRRMIESLNGVRLDSFESISQFDRSGHRVMTLPPSIAPVAYDKQGLLNWLISGEIRTTIFLDDEGEVPSGSLSFVYSRFAYAGYAFGAWLLFMFFLGIMLSNAQRKMAREFQRELDLQNAKSIHDSIQKVRHNIRSPLAVLGAYFTAPEEDSLGIKDQALRSVKRIEEILSEMQSGDLDATPKRKLDGARKALIEISLLTEEIFEEKKLIAPDIEISFTASEGPIYSDVSAIEFKTTLSNIIDNSIQAMGTSGSIELKLEADGHLISLRVKDSGHGIPAELIPKITQKHFTHGKIGGSGLGLFYAQKLMDENRGSLQIESAVGNGTEITLNFPQAVTPNWHCEEISLSDIQEVHVYDDQPLVLDLFRRRFASVDMDVKYHLVNKAEPVPVLNHRHIHLMDFDFGIGKKNGLQIMASSGIASQSVLVTGHYDDPAIQSACEAAGCRLLPKDRISSVRITRGNAI